MPPPESELLKYACNGFHAVKIAFANEVAALARANDVDPDLVMSTFVLDEKLNLSSKYLRPGFAFGGSCLPKDLRGLNSLAKRAQLDLPLITSVVPSNDAVLERAVEEVTAAARGGPVLMLGATFKPGTDDFRESPYLRLLRRLLDTGTTVRLVEPGVEWGRVTGANRAFLAKMLPELNDVLLEPAEAEVVRDWAVILGSRRDQAFEGVRQLAEARSVSFIDLGGVSSALPGERTNEPAGTPLVP
jgi:GDP-mannose 6-dehydrogenase